MRKTLLLIFILLFIFSTSFSQNVHRNFKGSVTDSTTGLPMKDVTIAFYKAQDTSLINFAFTTPNGNYTMELHLKDSIIIIISQMGYNDKTEKVPVAGWEWTFDEKNFKLSKSSHQLKEIKIHAGLIWMKGDTIEINAARLKVLPNSDVSQMFKKIPGFEVSKDGSIKVNGGEVSKIMVDGSDFFGSSPGLVSKNLRADMIDKVQVYDDKDETGSVVPDNTKTINLKLKKGSRIGMFGDAVAGYGTNDRYESGLRLNSFKNDRKWSLIANSNNVNDKGFDFGFNNWHGGSWVERTGKLSRYVYYNNQADDAERKGNINQKSDVAFTYFNEFSHKRKVSFNLGFNHNKFNSISQSTSENPVNDSIRQRSESSQILNGMAKEFTADINYTKETDTVGNWGIGVSGAYNLFDKNFQSTNRITRNDFVINSGTNNTQRNTTQQKANFYFDYFRRARKNKLLTFKFDVKSNINASNADAYQFSKSSSSDFNFKNNTINNGREHLMQANVTIPLHKKLRLGSTVDGYLMQTTNNINVLNAGVFSLQDFSQNYSQRNDPLSIKFLNSAQQISEKTFLSWRNDDWDFRFGATYLNLTLNNEDQVNHLLVNKNYHPILPFISYNIWRKSLGHANIVFEKAVEFPSFIHLLPIQDLTNPWMRLVGNPYLLPFEQWQLAGSFSKQNYKRIKNLWSNFSINQSDNYLCYVNTMNANGISYRTPTNLSGYFNESFSISAKTGLTKKLDLGVWFSERNTITPEIFNQQKNYGNNFAFNCFPTLSINGSEKIDFEFGLGLSYSDYKNNLNSTVNYHQWLPEINTNMRVNVWKGAELNWDLGIEDKRAIPGIGKVISIFNLFFQQALDKDEKYNLKFTCYDLFKQNITISRSVNGSFVNTSQSNLLQRFFGLSFIYKMKGKNSEGGGAAY
ncbi:MAG: hypothetical protein RL708_2359 [Bacteroidota bacterium]|jgi:hypothetical protein